MIVLITGICGFVGSTLARVWREGNSGWSIHGVDNLVRPGSEINRVQLQKMGIKLYHGDLRSISDIDALPAADWVIDAAANPSILAGIDGQTSSRQLIEHNLFGTVNILEYCKRHRSGLILLSTSRVYSIKPLTEVAVEPAGQSFRLAPGQKLPVGLTEAGISEAFATTPPLSLYGSAKLASEIVSIEYGETFDFPVWINRCGILAGAGQFGRADQGIIAFWINAWLRRKPLAYIGFGGKGYQVRDFLHPRDLALLLEKQMASQRGAESIVNIGGGTGCAMSLAELSLWCSHRFGPHEVVSEPLERRFDIPWLIMDATLAGKLWGWVPQTSREEILEEIALHALQKPDWLGLSGAL